MMTVALSVLVFSSLAIVDLASGQEKCNQDLAAILEHNSPQTIVIPDAAEINTFTSAQVRISISWTHIDEMLFEAGLKGRIDSYFIEHASLSSLEDDAQQDQVEHSPVIDPRSSSYSITVEDDCKIYSVVLGLVLNETKNSNCSNLLYSHRKLIWPSARHTNVNVFSNRAEFLWPSGCNYLMLPTWQMESCAALAEDDRTCRRDSLRGASGSFSRYEVTNLDPCQLWNFRLRAPPTMVDGVIKLGSVLWTFEASTVPLPHIQAIAGYDYLRLILDQSKCSTEAVIRDWRVTVCEDWNHNETSGECRNALHKLAFFNRQKRFSRGYLEIRPLKDCQLYTVAISPALADGSPVLPGEKYTSIHSTLCAPKLDEEDDLQPHMGNKSSNSELVVVLITMILIGSAMVCLALKSVSSLSTGVSSSDMTKTYYNPANCNYYDDHVLESMK